MDGWMVKGNTFILLRVVSKAKNHFTDERHKKTGSKKGRVAFTFFLNGWMMMGSERICKTGGEGKIFF